MIPQSAKLRGARLVAAIAGAVVVAGVLATFAVLRAVPKAGAGLSLVEAKATGQLADVTWRELYGMIRSPAHFSLSELARSRSAYAAIRNPYDSTSDIAAGAEVFQARCALCHGSDGHGRSGPSLVGRQLTHGTSDWALYRTIAYGVPGTAMPPNGLGWVPSWQVVGYVRSLTSGTGEAEGPKTVHAGPVSYERLVSADRRPEDWLTYSGTYDGHRFATGKDITPATVGQLRLLWMRQYETTEPSIEASPLVVDGTMFVTVPPSGVEALDAKTGAVAWSFQRPLPAKLSACCGLVNRGLAVLGDKLFFGTIDAHLVALEIATGKLAWDVTVADPATGHSITSAPLAYKNLVVTGIAGGEYGIRGFVSARDAATGREVWRFDTVAQPGQRGGETWSGSSGHTGGAPTWLTGSFDPATNTLYWPTGNPSPNFDAAARPGDNLYTNCVLALDPDTGALKWHFQYMPRDAFDWDATEILVLFDGNAGGRQRRLLAQANRNGFLYLLDASSGELLLSKPYAKQTWAKGTDGVGRPLIDPQAYPSETGATTFPGVGGGTNWQSPSYSPVTGRLYVSYLDWGGIFYKSHEPYHAGDPFESGSFQFFANGTSEAVVKAIDPLTGQVDWEYRNAKTNIGGVVSTAGGVVFGSQGQAFFALDAGNGRELWRVETGGRTVAAPIVFTDRGRSMVTIAAGRDLLTFGL